MLSPQGISMASSSALERQKEEVMEPWIPKLSIIKPHIKKINVNVNPRTWKGINILQRYYEEWGITLYKTGRGRYIQFWAHPTKEGPGIEPAPDGSAYVDMNVCSPSEEDLFYPQIVYAQIIDRSKCQYNKLHKLWMKHSRNLG